MKKVWYGLLLAAEILVGLLMVGLIYSNIGWIACVILLAVVAVLLVPLLRRLKTTSDAAARKKTLRQIALVVLLPAASGILVGIYVVVSLLLYFG